jgi:hypothetical protein
VTLPPSSDARVSGAPNSILYIYALTLTLPLPNSGNQPFSQKRESRSLPEDESGDEQACPTASTTRTMFLVASTHPPGIAIERIFGIGERAAPSLR